MTSFIDNILLKIKLPIEIKRGTRTISDKTHYKANEFRTLLFYICFGLFKTFLDKKYFNNFVKYLIFMRLLCQECVSKEDCHDAQLIIDDFVVEFEELYGMDAMSSNIHGHIHLPQQTLDWGPAHLLSAFHFENQFQEADKCHSGTRNLEGQIA